VQGVFGSAAAAGKLLQLNEDQLVNALGIAGSSAAGLQEFAWEGADMKATHAGRAAQLGLESALLARAGVLGPSTVLEGPFGYFTAFSLPTDPNKVVENLKVGAMRVPEHKHYATHTTHQPAIAAILRYTSEHKLDPTRIEQVIIRGPASILHPRHRALEPTTLMGARYSLPFTAAVALTRNIADPLAYDDSTLQDPLVLSLARRVVLQPANTTREGPHGLFADVSLVIDGRTIELQPTKVKGFYDLPYGWGDAVEKFQRFTHRLIGQRQSIEIIDLVARITDLDDLGVLARATAKRPGHG
jgi:2-methylcitrate dehydratase PrpD